MSVLPKDVIKVKRSLSRDPSHDLYEIAKKLFVETHELVSMWRTLERREIDKDAPWNPWVSSFLEVATEARNLPPFHYKPANGRRKLSNKIETLANQLVLELEKNGLDSHLIYHDGKIFNGFYFYEDFGDSNQARIDASQKKKLSVSFLIQEISKRAKQVIADEPIRGKAGVNVRAIRFIRIVAARNKRRYGEALNAATAVAANAIFDTTYQESDIAKIAQPLTLAI